MRSVGAGRDRWLPASTGTMDSPTRRELIDTVVDLYVAWRERSAAVGAAYHRFRDAPPSDRALAHAAYLAALDQEELAAIDYRRALERAIPVCREDDRVTM